MRRRLARSLVVVVMASLPIATAARLHTRYSEQAIWAAAVAHSPEKPRPWINLGRQYALSGANDQAMTALAHAIALADRPERFRVEGAMRGHHTARLNLALLVAAEGRYTEALRLTEPIQPRAFGQASLVTTLETQWQHAITISH